MSAPAITTLSPNVGPSVGGTLVTITGTGFTDAAHTTVYFGGVTASTVDVLSSTQMTAVSPAYTVGAGVDVVVQNQNGASATGGGEIAPYVFGYYPTINSVTDANGHLLNEAAPGTSIVLNGVGFGTPGAATTYVEVGWSSSLIAAGSNAAWGLGSFYQSSEFSNTQITTIVPNVAVGTWWFAASAMLGVLSTASNSVSLKIVAPLPPGLTPNITSVTNSNGQGLSTVSNGDVYVTNALAPGETIIINGTNFGAAQGNLEYSSQTGLSVGLQGQLGATVWVDFTRYCAISSWTDDSIELTLANGGFGQNNSASFQITVGTARTGTTSGAWSNSLFLNVVGPPTMPVIHSVKNSQNLPFPGAPPQVPLNTYITITGANFGASPGKVEWRLPVPPGTSPPIGSFNAWGTLYFTSPVLASEWTDLQITALSPPNLPYNPAVTGPRPTLLLRVVDANGNPSDSTPPGSVIYSQDAYSVLLVPPITMPIIVLGDSIQWGQGLRPSISGAPASDKMAELIGANLQRNSIIPSPATGFSVMRFAQSGATINSPPNTTVDVGVTPFPAGEVPAVLIQPPPPTILNQVTGAQQWLALFNETNSYNSIPLVILDGGINDVGLSILLNPSSDQATVRAMTNAACGGELNVSGAGAFVGANATTGQMSNLLTAVGSAFPNAVVVVTGYYDILSRSSDLMGLLAAVGALVGTLVSDILGPAGWLASVLSGNMVASDAVAPVIANCAAFKSTSDASLASAVALANAAPKGSFSAQVNGVTMTAPRFIFVPAQFQAVNALFTGGSNGADETTNTAPAFLWGFNPTPAEINAIVDSNVGNGSNLGGLIGSIFGGPLGGIVGSLQGALNGAEAAMQTILSSLSPVDEVASSRLGPKGACALSGNNGAIPCDLASVGHPNIEGEAAYAAAIFNRLFVMFGTTLPNMGLVHE